LGFGGDDLIANLRQFYDFGLNEDIAIASTLLDESFIPAIPEDARGGIPTAASYFMAVDTPENAAFLERFHERFGDDAIVTNIGEGTYNSIHLWAKAVEAAGALDKEAVIDALPTVTFAAPQGEIQIQEGSNHAILRSLIAETQADGTFTVLEDFGLVEPLSECEI
jgi:ABC-type branched-subunit amino acid transport system substrate-binding protein